MKAGYHEEAESEDEVVESKEKDIKKEVEEEEVETKEGMKKKSLKAAHCEETDEDSLDIKSDIDALVGDADLSEEFKQKAATIFEAAITSKVKAEQELSLIHI